MTPDVDARELEDAVADAIATRLAHHFPDGVTLVATNNRVRHVSYGKRRAHLRVRVSRRFMSLGEQVIEPVVSFVRATPGARGALRRLYTLLPPTPRRVRGRPTFNPAGHCYDLNVIVQRESRSMFGESADVDITWGVRRRRPRPQRSIRLGTYHFEQRYIRIHPRLDHPLVPEWYVGFVVYHELLHHRLGVTERGGRRVVHSRAFRLAEARHPRYQDARDWESRQLPKLLGGRGEWRSTR